MPIFKVDKNFEAVLNPEAVKLIPEISILTQKELLYVICVADYEDSPYRKKPIEERKILAKRKIFGKETVNESQQVKRALETYKSLVFDIRRETIDKYKSRILLLQKQSLGDEIDLRHLKEIDQAITFLTERVLALEHELDIEDQIDNIKLKGGRKLSVVEKWQRKQKAYREFQDQR